MKPIKCIFVGDLALGDHPKSVGFGFYSTYRDGIPPERARTLFPPGYDHDLLFGNLEFTLARTALTGKSHDELNCRGISRYAEFLQEAGFNLLNLANNHIFQHGLHDFEKTVQVLTEKGIGVVGLADEERRSKGIRVGDQSVCLLGWSARPRQGFVATPPYRELDERSCYREIAEAKENSSFVCVSLHWGEEFIEIPSAEEKRIARKMIDAGANAVIGHHPHVIREVEEYHGGLIAYSLGNFICDMTWNEKTRKTAFLYVEFAQGGVAKWEMVPGRIDDGYFPDFSHPTRHAPRSFTRLYSTLRKSSYPRMAQRALQQHQLLTVLHMLRNCARYRPGVWRSMLEGALKSRISSNR